MKEAEEQAALEEENKKQQVCVGAWEEGWVCVRVGGSRSLCM